MTTKPKLHPVLGHDGKLHNMTLLRSNGEGVGEFSNVTRKMAAHKLDYIRKRADRTAYEAEQRRRILHDPFEAIANAVMGTAVVKPFAKAA